MALPFIIAGVAIAAIGIYKKQRNLAEVETRMTAPGDAYRLPACCIDALKTGSNRGTLLACIGAYVASTNLLHQSQPQKPVHKSGGLPFVRMGKPAKSIHDSVQLVMIDWNKEADLHSEFMRGIITLGAISMFDVVERHYLFHIREDDSNAKKFWTRLYERKRDRLPLSSYREALRVIDEGN